MIEAAIMHQLVQEAAMGIGDILNAAAAHTPGGYVPRADRPDLVVVDPALAPLFDQATLLATELGITLPKVVIMPSAGLLELVSTRQWSRTVNPVPLAADAPLDLLSAAGYGPTGEFLTQLVAESSHSTVRLLAVGGTYTGELPYMDAPDEQIAVGGGTVQIAVVYLTPNYYPAEDGPLDLAALAEQAMLPPRPHPGTHPAPLTAGQLPGHLHRPNCRSGNEPGAARIVRPVARDTRPAACACQRAGIRRPRLRPERRAARPRRRIVEVPRPAAHQQPLHAVPDLQGSGRSESAHQVV